jgi:DNA-binding NarL/FixJ family response regulator
MKRSTVLIADDHAVVVEGLRRILDRPEFDVVGVANNGRELLRAAVELRPDVIVSDVAMPLLNGIDAAREIHKQHRKTKIIFLTMHPEPAYARAALASGASAYVLKSAAGEELINAIRTTLGGGTYVSKSIAETLERAQQIRPANGINPAEALTSRQREVLQMLAEGKQVKEIAAILGLSAKTVEFHKYRIMDVLGFRTVVDLARYAQKHGIVE